MSSTSATQSWKVVNASPRSIAQTYPVPLAVPLPPVLSGGAAMAGLLAGKRIVVTGVLTDDSLAYGVAELGPRGGGRDRPHRRRAGPVADPAGGPAPARHPADVLELDVTVPEQIDAVAAELTERWGSARRRAPRDRLRPAELPRRRLPRRRWDDVSVALQVSAYSLKAAGRRAAARCCGRPAAARVVGPRLRRHRGVAGLRLDGRGQGRARVDVALPGPGPRSRPHPGQPGRRRADADHGGQVDPRVLPVRGRLGRAGPARLERHRLDARWPRPAWPCCPTGSR